MPNLKFLALTILEIWWGLKILKVDHVTPLNPFDLILYFFVYVPRDQSACPIRRF